MYAVRSLSLLVAGMLVRSEVASALPTTRSTGLQVCDPMLTEPVYGGTTPTSIEVLGIEFGERPVTSAESDEYLQAVADASERVIGPFELPLLSVRGQPLKYVLVGNPQFLGALALEEIKVAMALLRDPETPEEVSAEIIANSPPFTWMGACVHGGEKSGTDAALKMLYELADRTDCAAEQIIDNQVLVVFPNQNPDGRDDASRRNANGFDMNRDWFAQTQPETRGKLAVLEEYPPVMFMDIHEMGGTQYFFPPNADPYYHEVSNASVGYLNDLYGPAMAAEFTRQGIPFFTSATFDLFYAGYGDTAPTLGWNSAGMTFEQGSASPFDVKVYNQWLASWMSASAAGMQRQRVLADWHNAYVEAAAQGAAGLLQPNQVFNPGNEVEFEVPDITVRNYFMMNEPSKLGEISKVLERLAIVGVEVAQLTAPLEVPDYVAYGRSPAPTTLPIGTYIIPMAQGNKHFVQTTLNEGSYTPFEYFYDLTGWSAMILENVPGGWATSEISEVVMEQVARRTTAKAAAAAAAHQAHVNDAHGVLSKLRHQPGAIKKQKPKEAAIAVLAASANSPGESFDWLAYKLNTDWELPFISMLPSEIAQGIPATVEVLIVPQVSATAVYAALGTAGREAIASWVASGGHMVTWQGGAQLASELGLSMTQFDPPSSSCPGSFFRVIVDNSHPLADGVGEETFMYYRSTLPVMRSFQHRIVGFFPDAASSDFYCNGFHEGSDVALSGSTAVHQRVVESGLVTSFAYEINFRAFTGGTSKLLLNAINQNVAETVRRESQQQQQPSKSFMRKMKQQNATRGGAQLPLSEDAGLSAALAVDWIHNVMITVSLGSEHDNTGATATGLTNCSACTFEDMCKAADNPGDCHWCPMPAGHGGKSYCEVKGKLCRRGGGDPPLLNSVALSTAAGRDEVIDARLAAAMLEAAAIAGITGESTSGSAAITPVFVQEVRAAGKDQETIRTYLLPNDEGRTVDEHPWWRHLPATMKRAGLLKARTYF